MNESPPLLDYSKSIMWLVDAIRLFSRLILISSELLRLLKVGNSVLSLII
jgi:hypothetical protein